MQQTENLKLNLIETGDPFSPAPLNENADTVDAALADHEQRVIALEGCRIVVGTYHYYAGSEGQIIDLGGRPTAVLVAGHGVTNPYVGFVLGDQEGKANFTGKLCLRIVDNGFQVCNDLSTADLTLSFLAFLGDWAPLDIPAPTAQ